MAKADRNATTRSSVTGENYKQALHWLRQHGLTGGVVPDAEDPTQQLLEAALLAALARTRGPLGPVEAPRTLFGIAKASPAASALTVWPAPGLEAAVLSRLLPARSPDGTVHGVPALRWSAEGRHLALAVPDQAGRVLLAATAHDARAARQLAAEAGLDALTQQPVANDEKAAWRERAAALQGEAQGWSRALRRPLLALALRADLTWKAPSWEALAGDEEDLRPRPHGPDAFRSPRVVHVRAGRGGTGVSTISVQVAYGLARSGAEVALVTDAALLHSEASRAPAGEVWHSVDVPTGAGHLRVASAGRFGQDLDARAAEATQHGHIVVLDIGSGPASGLPRADLTLVTGRYAGREWIRTEFVDRRPAAVQAYDRLDQLFDGVRAEGDELRRLLSALDCEFVAYAAGRLDDADEQDADVYDPQDAEDVAEWWELFQDAPLHAEDVLPAEECAPLAQWRTDLLEFIDAEARRRYPELWEQARAVWPEHNRRRNLQRLGTEGDTVAELAVRLEDFLSRLDNAGRPSCPVDPGVRRAWYEGRLARWLEGRFSAHLEHDAVTLAASDADRLLSVLDARFLPQIPAEVLRTECAHQWWWDAHAAARSLDPYDLRPYDPSEGVDLDHERARFVRIVDSEGLRRHPGLWPKVRERWADHHAELTEAHRRPFQPDPQDLPALRRAFADRLRQAGGDAVPGWQEVAGRWSAGERTDPERVSEFADLVDRLYHPAEPDAVADALAREVRTLGVDGPAAVVVTFYRAGDAIPPVPAVADALVPYGVTGLATVPQLRRLERLPFEPTSWNDSRVRAVQEDLAALVTGALHNAGADRTRS
ncbi:hypothetical protein ACWC6I_25135 [Streptomyces sp. NPDC001414]